MFSNGNHSIGNAPVLFAALVGAAATKFLFIPASGAMRRHRQIKE